jgi:xanthine dehydrogenase YagS FAD-binding subunit
MKSFALSNPKSLEQAVLRLSSAGRDPRAQAKIKLLAGGQDLLTEMKEHLAEPEELVNLKTIPGLDGIEDGAKGELVLGALATLSALERHGALRDRYRAVHEAAASIASPQIRSVGTIGGNLCQRPRCWYYRNENAKCLKKGGSECLAYAGLNKYNAIFGGGPSYIVHPSDLAPALVASGAQVTLHGAKGDRTLPLEQFFTLPAEASVLRENVLAADEILTRVTLPAPLPSTRSTYLKFKERGSYDFALCSVALSVAMDGDKIAAAHLVLGGVAPIPWRCTRTEKLLAGRKLEEATYVAAAEDALKDAEPLEHNGYKVPLAQGLIRRAFQSLARG